MNKVWIVFAIENCDRLPRAEVCGVWSNQFNANAYVMRNRRDFSLLHSNGAMWVEGHTVLDTTVDEPVVVPTIT